MNHPCNCHEFRYPLELPRPLTVTRYPNSAHEDRTKKSISGETLQEKLHAGWNPVILDVRSSIEYRSGHVPGALHLPFWKAWFQRASVPAGPDEPVVVYCEHGPRAYLAAWGLKNAGFRDVRVLEGHMLAWRQAGREVEKPGS